MTDTARSLPTFADVLDARDRLAKVVDPSPLLRSRLLDERVGGRVLLKAECLNMTGSFKIRGAYNRLSRLDDAQRRAGVVAFSSGNHAQAIAAAAAMLRLPAAIVMPADAPPVKIANTRALGAEVILYDRYTETREAIAARLAVERGATLVPSYDDFHVIAGQGTCGVELAEQASALSLELASLHVCVGGGGLLAGCALALEALSPRTLLYSVEPARFDDHRRSFAAGHRAGNDMSARSFCDALLAPTPGELTFAINRPRVCGGVVVTDEDVSRAISYAARSLKLVLEPGGAVALAALLAGKIDVARGPVAITLSGGNIDPAILLDCLTRWEVP